MSFFHLWPILDIYIIFYMYTYKQNGELGYLYLDMVIFQYIPYLDRQIDRYIGKRNAPVELRKEPGSKLLTFPAAIY